MQKVLVSKSVKETYNIGNNLASKLKKIALVGDLGAGKTIFAKGFAGGLGIKDKILSPTFTIIRQHPIPKIKKTFYHVDLYRLENIDLDELGLNDILKQEDFILIEWADKIKDKLPKNTTWVEIEKINESERKISIFDNI